jgi:hypothetical protein
MGANESGHVLETRLYHQDHTCSPDCHQLPITCARWRSKELEKLRRYKAKQMGDVSEDDRPSPCRTKDGRTFFVSEQRDKSRLLSNNVILYMGSSKEVRKQRCAKTLDM